jgi:hypothetical protein
MIYKIIPKYLKLLLQAYYIALIRLPIIGFCQINALVHFIRFQGISCTARYTGAIAAPELLFLSEIGDTS